MKSKKPIITESEFDYKVRKQTWKNFFKYKIMELGIIPLSIFAIWKVPLWIGYGTAKLLHIDLLQNTFFCVDTGTNPSIKVCDGVNYLHSMVWLLGIIVSLILFGFIYFNYDSARWKAVNKIEDEYRRKDD